jgi:hypothetical protein
MSGKGYISTEPDDECAFCGAFTELRPYGPNKERICFDCAMKDKPTAKRQMADYIYRVSQ